MRVTRGLTLRYVDRVVNALPLFASHNWQPLLGPVLSGTPALVLDLFRDGC